MIARVADWVASWTRDPLRGTAVRVGARRSLARMSAARLVLAGLLGLACWTAAGAAPDLAALPPHPRLWIGGIKTAPGYINPATLAGRARTCPKAFAYIQESDRVLPRALAAVIDKDPAKIERVAKDIAEAKATDTWLYEYALAFDWIAASLKPDRRKALAAHLADLAMQALKRSHPGYILTNYHIGAHLAIGLTALAIAEDDPRAGELMAAADEFFTEWRRMTGDGAPADDLLGRPAYGGGWPESHDYDRHGARYALFYLLGLRSATGADYIRGSAHWKAKPLYHIYTLLPNGYNILPFDDDDNPYLHRFDREVMVILAREFNDPHARWYCNHVNPGAPSPSMTLDFLFDEPRGPEHDFTDLPRAHYIPGIGAVYARSGWGSNDTYVAFRANDWFVYHENNAQNVFAIYRNAPLAIKDGVYDGRMHPHYYGYSIRTIAYNGITVLDPAERFQGPEKFEPPAGNDGGQMIQQWRGLPRTLEDWRAGARRASGGPMYDITDWLAFETNAAYMYCAAETGRAYRPGKVPFFSRQLLFIYPNWVVVFDRVSAGNPEFVKTFHLHAPDELTVSGRAAVVTTRKAHNLAIPGRLFVKSLLPAKAELKNEEGLAPYAGRSWVGPTPTNDQYLCRNHLRIIAPREKETFFLTAMYACDANVTQAPPAEIVGQTEEKVAVSLAGKWKAVFNKTGAVGWKME